MATAAEGPSREYTPYSLIGQLAQQGYSAAQTAVGVLLAREGDFDGAVDWLRAASRTGNLVANTLLAQIHLQRARMSSTDDERTAAMDLVLENYLHAIALGSTEAMYDLAALYINGHYGDDNRLQGVPLLEQARDLENSQATVFLAHLYYTGEVVDRNLDTARSYYAQAADTGNETARKSYARFLLDRDAEQAGDPRAVAWLEELAEDGEAESMLLLGNLYARGVGTDRSVRNAVRWFEEAVDVDPQDANIVNEVAWTLTVSDQAELRRSRYARRIMNRLMEKNEEARQRPEYLDTWAATHAASGDFERAVVVQQQALDVALAADYEEVLDILREHLEAFKAGETISEAVP
jgi:TPR repeat protein